MPLTTALLLSGLLFPGFAGCEHEPDPSRVPAPTQKLGSEQPELPKLERKHEVYAHDQAVSLAFSRDGSELVSSGLGESMIIVFDVPSGRDKSVLRHSGAGVVRFAPDSDLIALAGEDAALWDRRRSLVRLLPLPWEVDGGFGDLAFTPDGKRLVAANSPGEITVWNVETARIEREWPQRHRRGVTSIHISPDGDRLVSGDFAGNIVLSDLKTGEVRQQLREGTGKLLPKGASTDVVWQVQFSPDGTRIAAVTSTSGVAFPPTHTSRVEFWRLPASEPDQEWQPDGTIDPPALRSTYWTFSGALDFSPDGKLLAVAGQGALSGVQCRGFLYSVETRKPLAVFDQVVVSEAQAEGGLPWKRHEIHCLAFAPNGRLIAAGDSQGTLILWKIPQSPADTEPNGSRD